MQPIIKSLSLDLHLLVFLPDPIVVGTVSRRLPLPDPLDKVVGRSPVPVRPLSLPWGAHPPPPAAAMPHSPPEPLDPAAAPRTVLLDRHVGFVDLLDDPALLLDPAPQHIVSLDPAAFEILRERKRAFRRGAMFKEPVTFSPDDDAAAYYRQLFDGIDPHLPHLTRRGDNDDDDTKYLTIGISWPPDHHLRSHPNAGFVASCHQNLLALYFGTYRPGNHSPGCYLVINTWANSVAIVPPLPAGIITAKSLRGIGTSGVAVLRHNMYSDDYVLAELFLHHQEDGRSYLPSNKATLFLWWSPGSAGPLLAGRWIRKEVVLPLPAQEGTYAFRADMVFALANTSLCWVDLRAGILVCDRIDKLIATGTADIDDDLVFRFIPLPQACAATKAAQWSPAEESRTMFCVDSENIMFVCLDNYTRGCPIEKPTLTIWILKSPMTTSHWEWHKHSPDSWCVLDLMPPPSFLKKNNRKQLLLPSHPVISMEGSRVLINLIVTEFDNELRRGQREPLGFFKLSFDTNFGAPGALPTFSKCSSPEKIPVQYPRLFAASIISDSDKQMELVNLQLHRLALLESPSMEEAIDEDECWEWVLPEGMDDDDKKEFIMKMGGRISST